MNRHDTCARERQTIKTMLAVFVVTVFTGIGVCPGATDDVIDDFLYYSTACPGYANAVWADVDGNGEYDTQVVFETVTGWGDPMADSYGPGKWYFFAPQLTTGTCAQPTQDRGRIVIYFVDILAAGFVVDDPGTWTHTSVGGVSITASHDMCVGSGVSWELAYQSVQAYQERFQTGPVSGTETPVGGWTQYDFEDSAGIMELYVTTDYCENLLDDLFLSEVTGPPAPSRWDGGGASPPSAFYSLPASWDPDHVPTATETVLFDLAESYTVKLDLSPTNEYLQFEAGNVTFEGHTSARDYTISEDVKLTGGALTLDRIHLSVGGDISVENGHSLLVAYKSTLTGSSGTDLTIDAGGQATVSGSSSQATGLQSITVGDSAGGSFTVSNGADVSSTYGYIGRKIGSNGVATVTGLGSSWTNSGSMYVGGVSKGAGGTGELVIDSGGLVEVGDTLKIWRHGTVTLNDGTLSADTIVHTSGGAFAFAGGVLHVDNFQGDLLNQAGTLAPGTSLGETTVRGNYEQGKAGWLEIEVFPGTILRPKLLRPDVVTVSDEAHLGGTLQLIPAGGFIPRLNQKVTVLTAAGGVYNRFGGYEGPIYAVEYGSDYVRVTMTWMGDCNRDGAVDDDDLSLLLANWKFGDRWGEGDLNCDGKVGDDDLSLLLAGWTGSVAIPEPATLSLLALGVILLRHKRHPWPPTA